MKYKIGMALVCGASLLGMSGCSDVSEKPSNADVAKAWIEAGQIGQEATIGAVEQYMAEDGLFYRPRYVGFGLRERTAAIPSTFQTADFGGTSLMHCDSSSKNRCKVALSD